MKNAINQVGEAIPACAGAPPKAICPYCKETVLLRTRRRSLQEGGVTYFWRHEDHTNRRCPARKPSVITG
jgi:hypothetical protein